MARLASTLALAAAATSTAAQTSIPDMPPMVVHTIPTMPPVPPGPPPFCPKPPCPPPAPPPTPPKGFDFGLVMPATGSYPLPRLAIALSADYKSTLLPGPVLPGSPPDKYYYANACPWLVQAGWACASLDLPSHGTNVLKGEPTGIAGWRWRTDRNIDFVNSSRARIDQMINFLAANKLTNGTNIAITGISRGGYLAATYAAAAGTEKVSAVGLLSPVTNLSLLAEFAAENATMQAKLATMELAELADQLAPQNVWTIIGDEDPRVFTDACISTMRTYQCSGCKVKSAFSCSGCDASHGDSVLTVPREPKGHVRTTSPPPPLSLLSPLRCFVVPRPCSVLAFGFGDAIFHICSLCAASCYAPLVVVALSFLSEPVCLSACLPVCLSACVALCMGISHGVNSRRLSRHLTTPPQPLRRWRHGFLSTN
eukprot:COSAG05_NODE_504_length_9208_cov_22.420024_2_plen_426_part_00